MRYFYLLISAAVVELDASTTFDQALAKIHGLEMEELIVLYHGFGLLSMVLLLTQ